jgi:hypothetical protein
MCVHDIIETRMLKKDFQENKQQNFVHIYFSKAKYTSYQIQLCLACLFDFLKQEAHVRMFQTKVIIHFFNMICVSENRHFPQNMSEK